MQCLYVESTEREDWHLHQYREDTEVVIKCWKSLYAFLNLPPLLIAFRCYPLQNKKVKHYFFCLLLLKEHTIFPISI